jgi:amidase
MEMKVEGIRVEDGKWEVVSDLLAPWTERPDEKGVPNPEKAMVIVLVKGKNGRPTGKMLFA